MRKIENYFDTFLDELEKNTCILIPSIIGIILFILWSYITQQAENYEEFNMLALSIIVFIMSISGILGFRKGVFLQVVIIKGMIARIFNLIFLIITWGTAILLLLLYFRDLKAG